MDNSNEHKTTPVDVSLKFEQEFAMLNLHGKRKEAVGIGAAKNIQIRKQLVPSNFYSKDCQDHFFQTTLCSPGYPNTVEQTGIHCQTDDDFVEEPYCPAPVEKRERQEYLVCLARLSFAFNDLDPIARTHSPACDCPLYEPKGSDTVPFMPMGRYLCKHYSHTDGVCSNELANMACLPSKEPARKKKTLFERLFSFLRGGSR